MYCCILHRGVGKRSTNYRPNVPFKHMDKPLNLATSFLEYFIYSYTGCCPYDKNQMEIKSVIGNVTSDHFKNSIFCEP